MEEEPQPVRLTKTQRAILTMFKDRERVLNDSSRNRMAADAGVTREEFDVTIAWLAENNLIGVCQIVQ